MQVIVEPGQVPIKAWIEAVMAAQSDLVDIVHTLKQCVCIKG